MSRKSSHDTAIESLSERVLLLWHLLLNANSNTWYHLSEFITPFRYPRKQTTDSWEAFRTLYCLLNLKKFGISIVGCKLDPSFFVIAEELEIFRQEFIRGKYLSVRKVRKLYQSHICKGINWMGRGIFPGSELNPEIRSYFIAPQFLSLRLSLDTTLLQQKFDEYLRQYGKGILKYRASNFGILFLNRLFQKFLKTMRYRQGKNIALSLAGDEFQDVFKQVSQSEHRLWKKGTYDLLFWHHLLYLDSIGEVKIDCVRTGIHSKHTGLHGWNEVALDSHIHLEIPEPKPTKPPFLQGDTKVEILEITRSETSHYLLYVNQNYDLPITMSRRHKSGELIYKLATDGYVSFEPFARVYEYVRTDNRFKVFSQTNLPHAYLIDRDSDGYIVPTKHIKISFL